MRHARVEDIEAASQENDRNLLALTDAVEAATSAPAVPPRSRSSHNIGQGQAQASR